MRNTLLLLCILITIAHAQWAKAPLQPPAHLNPNLYPANADARQEIAEAIAAAGKENKRVLLVFGGNWCLDCHILDNVFHQPRVAPVLNQNFKVVHVDVGEYDKNLDLAKKYHMPLEKGVPSIAILNRHGEALGRRIDRWSLRNRPGEEDAVPFQSKVVMEMTGLMLLDNKRKFLGGTPLRRRTFRLGCCLEIPLGAIFCECHSLNILQIEGH